MRVDVLRISAAGAIAAVLVPVAAVLLAQAPSGATSGGQGPFDTDAAIKAATGAAKAAADLKNWTVPRTPWGDPDLRGAWLTATYTPLQRPPELGSKAFYTEEEAIAAFKKAVETDAEADPSVVHYDWKEYGMEAWQGGARPNLRTSLIVDPPDGRLPRLSPEAQQRREAAAAAAKVRSPLAGIRTFGNLYTRCVLGLGAIPLVRGGNPGAESAAAAAGVTAEALFFQSPGYMTIVMQSNNDVRIIPLDGRPQLPSSIRHWLGESRGRWDGNTLVVETSNFNDKTPATNFQGSTDSLGIVERFTRTGPNTIQYQYTISDPRMWTRSWSVEAPLPRVDPPIVYEFACHEQNYGVINVVRGTQIREREAAGRGGRAGAPPAAGAN